jgi:flagellar biosynthesis protein FlhB
MATRSDTDQRTEQPTRERLAEARRTGQVARSADLTGAAVILAAVVSLWLGGRVLLDALVEMIAGMLSFAPSRPAASDAVGAGIWSAAEPVMWIAICFCGVMMLGAVLAGVAQVGLLVSSEATKPRMDRLSPAQGLGRVFSSRGLVRAMLALAKIAAVGFVAWITIADQLPQIAADCGLSLKAQWSGAWTMLGQIAWRVVLVLGVLGVIDWAWQWRRNRLDLMMTRREVLDDLRKTQGDPLVRAKLRGAGQADVQNSLEHAGDEL